MKKQDKLFIWSSVLIIIIAAGGWYAYKYRSCLGQVSYVPAREGRTVGTGFSGARNSVDKGDYYRFNSQPFGTSDEAIRACMWQ